MFELYFSQPFHIGENKYILTREVHKANFKKSTGLIRGQFFTIWQCSIWKKKKNSETLFDFRITTMFLIWFIQVRFYVSNFHFY